MSSSAEHRGARVLRDPTTLRAASVVSPSGTVVRIPRGANGEKPIEERLEEARLAGFEEGRVAAASDALVVAELRRADALHATAAAIASACAAVAANRQAVVDEVVSDALDLVFELVELLVGESEGGTIAQARASIARALAVAPADEDLRIRLHPSCELSREAIEGAVVAGRVEIVADPGVEPGGCIVEAGACRIDAQITPALKRVRAALEEARFAPLRELS